MAEKWESEDPFAWENEDPFAEEKKEAVAPSSSVKASAIPVSGMEALRKGAKAVGTAVLDANTEVPKFLYEGVAAPVNAIARTLRYAGQYFPSVQTHVLQGRSFEDALQQTEKLRQSIGKYNMLPPTLGQGSRVGQAIGSGANYLAEKAGISPETMQVIGDTLAAAGVPGLRKGASMLANRGVNRFASGGNWIPSAAERAGQRWVNAQKTLPPETPQGASEIARIAQDQAATSEAAKTLGVERLPRYTDPNYRMQQLARERAHSDTTGRVYTSEAELADIARKKASEGVDRLVPSENVDPARLDFVAKKLEAYNQAQVAAAEAGKVAGKEGAALATKEAALAELEKLEAAVPPKTKFDKQGFGSRLLNRLRGKTEGEVKTGVEAVRGVFNKEYGKFDALPEAVAPSGLLSDALKSARESSVESGQILRNFVDEQGKVEGRLVAGDVTAEAEVALPENLTLKQWRGLKGEFYDAAERAKAADKYQAAREFTQLGEVAKQGEMQAVKQAGDGAASGYSALSKAYDDVMLRAYRRGLGGKVLEHGSQATKSKFTEEGITAAVLKSPSNARDLVAALGAEKAAQSGTSVVGLNEIALAEFGRGEARALVRPLVESELAEIYARKGGGKPGAAAVQKYLADKGEVLSTYGLDFDALQKAATNYNEALSRLSGAKSSVAKGIVADTLTTDPAKIGSFVLDSPNTAYKNLLGVSKDPAWKSSIDTLVKDEIKSRIEKGENPFSNVKSRAAMEQVFSSPQMKALEAYHTILKKLKDSPANFAGADLAQTPLHTAVGAAQALPVGMGLVYTVKYSSKFLAKLGLNVLDEAAASFLDDALIDPVKARTITDAYKGSRLARKDMMKGIEKERTAVKTLTKAIPQTAKSAVPGAVSGGVERKKEEPKPETPSTFGDEYIPVPRGSSGIRG